jgi:putative hydrolase of the HAD superfamily
MTSAITTLFLDVGGVLLTNGWDRKSRAAAAQAFDLDLSEMDERHHLTFDTYEEGKLSLDSYLDRVVFYAPRSFSRHEFREFMFARSKPYPEMIELVRSLKARHGLRVAVVSNEGRELTEYRIRAFGLDAFVDSFIFSCFVHVRKPDLDMYTIALDVSHARPEQVAYIDDRSMFVEVARSLGIAGIRHVDLEATRRELAAQGLEV